MGRSGMRKAFGALAVLAACLVAATSVSVATAAESDVCPPGDLMVEWNGEDVTLTVNAPAGTLITAYCVKAGSAKQGCGPSGFIQVNPPAASVTITGTCGKGISHYSLLLTDAPHEPPPPEEPPHEEPPHEPPPPEEPPHEEPPHEEPPH
jgi:hypothetical protein